MSNLLIVTFFVTYTVIVRPSKFPILQKYTFNQEALKIFICLTLQYSAFLKRLMDITHFVCTYKNLLQQATVVVRMHILLVYIHTYITATLCKPVQLTRIGGSFTVQNGPALARIFAEISTKISKGNWDVPPKSICILRS